MNRSVSEYPAFGWTEKVHPKCAEKSPLEAAQGVVRRVVNVTNPRARQLFKLERQDAAARLYMQDVLSGIADDVELFVQIGAHDGSFDDPFAEYVDRFQKSILVEPQQELFDKLSVKYADSERISVRRAAIAESCGILTLFKAATESVPEFGTAIAALSEQQVKGEIRRCLGRKALSRARITVEDVPAITMVELLNDELAQSRHLTLLASDTEGSDALVVEGVVRELGLRPDVIAYEHLHVPEITNKVLRSELAAMGYSLTSTHKDTLAVA